MPLNCPFYNCYIVSSSSSSSDRNNQEAHEFIIPSRLSWFDLIFAKILASASVPLNFHWILPKHYTHCYNLLRTKLTNTKSRLRVAQWSWRWFPLADWNTRRFSCSQNNKRWNKHGKNRCDTDLFSVCSPCFWYAIPRKFSHSQFRIQKCFYSINLYWTCFRVLIKIAIVVHPHFSANYFYFDTNNIEMKANKTLSK